MAVFSLLRAVILCLISGVAWADLNDSVVRASDAKDVAAKPDTIQQQPPRPLQDPEAGNDWKIEVDVYGWLPSVSATINLKRMDLTAGLDKGDLLDMVNLAAFTHVEASKDRWTLFGDAMYVRLAEANDVRLGALPLGPEHSVSANLNLSMFEFGGMYTWPRGEHRIDLLAGGRYIYFDTTMELGPVSIAVGKNWIDPFVGGRIRWRLSDRWEFWMRGDVGGFGVGSEFSWGADALLRYRLSKNAYAGIGYKALDLDRDKFGIKVDALMHGPLVGVGFRF